MQNQIVNTKTETVMVYPLKSGKGNLKLKKHHVRVLQTQFPLILCWAVRIHKCQGKTLPEIVVDMHPKKGTFRDGQAYVM